MKLFLISQSENNGYDTYDSAVVAAKDEEAARRTHPSAYGEYKWFEKHNSWGRLTHNGSVYMGNEGTWAHIDDVQVKYLAEYEGEAGIICASFNAG